MKIRFLIVAGYLLLGASCAFGDILTDQAAVDRYLQQGKFDLAEMLCREQLQGEATIEKRSAFTVELLRVLTEKARQSTMVEADAIFRNAKTAATTYLASDRESTQRWLVEFQMALLPRLRGDLRQWQMGGVRGDALHLQYLRDSLKQLHALAQRMDVGLRKSKGRASKNGLSAKAMRELRGRVALEIGKTYRAQAEAYPTASNDRGLAAAEGVETLERISPTSMTPEWWWRSRMELLACLRLRSDWKAFDQRFEVMLADKMPRSGKMEMQAEAIRVALAKGNWSVAKSLVAEGVPSFRLTDPAMRLAADDLSLAYIEAYLALATRAEETGDSVAARDYESRAGAAVDARKDASAYWARRVESLLARGSQGSTGSPGGFPLTVRAARGLYRQGKLPEAAAAYQRAAEQAGSTGDRREAFSLAMTAAGILVQSNESYTAAKQLRRLAVSNADLPAAPDAHLLAIKLVAPKSDETADGKVVDRKQYGALLDEHVKWWPQSKTTDQVAWWRGRAREHAGQYAAALQDYLRVSGSDQDRERATEAIERCVRGMSGNDDNANGATNADGDEKGKGLAAAVSALVAVASSPSATDLDRDEAAVSAARIAMLGGTLTKELELAVSVLKRRMDLKASIVPMTSVVSATSTDEARLVLAEGLYRMGQQAAAEQEIEKVAGASAEDWLRLLQSSQPAESATVNQRQSSAAWRLILLQRGASAARSLTGAQRLLWDRWQVIALADAGTEESLADASRRMSDLIQRSPKDAQLRELHARLLTDSGKDTGTAAINAWRLVISGSPPQSQRWYDAKYELAKLHLEQGNSDRAAQMIELLQALHPDLGGAAQKAKFAALLKKCQQ